MANENQHNKVDLKRRKPVSNFTLQKMETIYIQSQGKSDVAHRHDYFTILLVRKARGNHVIDYQSYPFGEEEVHFVSPGQIHQVLTDAIPDGWVITFSRQFLADNFIPENFISNINLFRQFGETPPLKVEPEIFSQLQNIVFDMQNAIDAGVRYRDRALGALLQLFLIRCSNICTLDFSQFNEEDSDVCLFRDFKKMVEEKYMDWHQVGQYAAAIYLTPKHLSSTVKKVSGQTAKEIIQDRITLEAKRLLRYTALSIKEIAYQLGFAEPLHFSSFIRKQTGMSPTMVRTGP